MKLILMIGLAVLPARVLACEHLFSGESEALVSDAKIPLPELSNAVAKFVPQFNGDPSFYLTWTFFPRGRRMAVQVHTLSVQSRLVDVGILTTIALNEDGSVLWQSQRGQDAPGPVYNARINAATARSLIARGYDKVHDDEPAAREVWELLAHLLPEHRVWPLGS